MEAPRQKLMKESATVVATTTFGADDRSEPSVGDITRIPFYDRWAGASPAVVQTGRQPGRQVGLQDLRGGLIDVVCDSKIFNQVPLRRVDGVSGARIAVARLPY